MPKPISINEEALKKAAARISKSAQAIQERMIKEALLGERLPYSPFVSTARMADSIARRPITFRPFIPPFDVIASPYVVETKKLSREKKRGFWRRLWDGLTDQNAWTYSPIEYYEIEVPTIVVDRRNGTIICHPSLEHDIKKALYEREIR